MIILISPAKTLDFKPANITQHTLPQFLEETKVLVKEMKKKSSTQLRKMMKVSKNIADLNVQRYQTFSFPFTQDNAKQALLAFKGDVYQGLEATSLTADELEYAQEHLRILSGLYGLLKPMDLIQPYRLEMGVKLKFRKYQNLYQFWNHKITDQLNHELASHENPIVVNLASKEYYKSIKEQDLSARVINIDFRELRNGEYKFISFSAKKARGMMSRYIIKHRIKEVEHLKGFMDASYTYHESLSSPDNLVFTR